MGVVDCFRHCAILQEDDMMREFKQRQIFFCNCKNVTIAIARKVVEVKVCRERIKEFRQP